MTDKELKAGKLLAITSGIDETLGVLGFFVALKTFKPKAMLAEYLSTRPAEPFKGYEFVSFLVGNGLLLEIEYSTLHAGDDDGTASEVELYE